MFFFHFQLQQSRARHRGEHFLQSQAQTRRSTAFCTVRTRANPVDGLVQMLCTLHYRRGDEQQVRMAGLKQGQEGRKVLLQGLGGKGGGGGSACIMSVLCIYVELGDACMLESCLCMVQSWTES